jgi:hypothetical protein
LELDLNHTTTTARELLEPFASLFTLSMVYCLLELGDLVSPTGKHTSLYSYTFLMVLAINPKISRRVRNAGGTKRCNLGKEFSISRNQKFQELVAARKLGAG